MTLIVIAGGLSHERDVSLRSGRRIAQELRDAGQDVVEADADADLLEVLTGAVQPVAVPMLHGGSGENGALREVLELLGVAFVGSAGAPSRLAFDKSIATSVVASAGITVPRQVALPDDIFRDLGASALMEAIGQQLGFPLIVKPSRSGSALGVTRVDEARELPEALVAAYAYGSVAVIETFIDGTEIAVTVLDEGDGPTALPPVEIRPSSGIYDYEARYTVGATRFVTPADLPAGTLVEAGVAAVAAHRALGLRDLSRIDLIVRPDGRAVFIEANLAPGMTETSLSPLAFEAADLDLGEVFIRLAEQALAR